MQQGQLKKTHRTRFWTWLTVAAAVGLLSLALYAWPRQVPLAHSFADGTSYSTGWVGRACMVDLSHLGLHTHRNKIKFDLSELGIPTGATLRIVPRCRYETDKLGIIPIEEWVTLYTATTATVTAPSRFADMVALISPIAGNAYLCPESYYCEVAWDRR